ncbi:MAG TPA: Ig-like domain-containing protein [Polyangiaceae bacterium]
MRGARTCILLALAAAGAGCGGSSGAESSDASSDGSEPPGPDGAMGSDAGNTDGTVDGTLGDGTTGYAGGAVKVTLASCDGGAEGTNVTGTVAIVMVAATPAAISKIDVLVDGKSLGTVTSMPFDLPWSSSAVSNGPHTISGTAYDLAGKTAAATPLQVTTNNFQLAGTWSWSGITDATAGFPTDTCSNTTFDVTFDVPTSTVTVPDFYVNCIAGNGAGYQAQFTGFTTVVTPAQYGAAIHYVSGTITTDFSATRLTQSNSFDSDTLSGALTRISMGTGPTTCGILGTHDAGVEAGPEAGSDASNVDASGTDASGTDASGTDGAACLPISGPDAGGGSVCTLGQASCGDSTSVDICGDPNNCGGCGTSCALPQRCCSGGCGAFATTPVSTSDYAWGVAVDATSVYWTDNVGGSSGVIRKMNRDGSGAVVTVASGQSAPQPIVVDSAAVYWLNGAGGPMSVATGGGGTPRSLATSSPISYPHYLAIDDSYVYWTGDNGGVTIDATVQRVSKCGGAPETVASEPGTEGTADIVTDGTFAYYVVWTAGGNSTYLDEVPVGGGTPTLLATGNTTQSGLALAAGTLYWKDCVIGSPLSCVIKALPTTGGTPRLVATDNTDYQSQLAVDDEYVYWTDWDPVNPEGGYGPGTIQRAPIAGGPAVVLSQSENLPQGIAVDRQYVFWANYTLSGPGSLRRGCK